MVPVALHRLAKSKALARLKLTLPNPLGKPEANVPPVTVSTPANVPPPRSVADVKLTVPVSVPLLPMFGVKLKSIGVVWGDREISTAQATQRERSITSGGYPKMLNRTRLYH